MGLSSSKPEEKIKDFSQGKITEKVLLKNLNKTEVLRLFLKENGGLFDSEMDFTSVINHFVTDCSVSNKENQTDLAKRVVSLTEQLEQAQRENQSEKTQRINRLRHRDLCALIYFIMNNYPHLLPDEIKNIVTLYLNKVFEKCCFTNDIVDMPTMPWVMVAGDCVLWRNNQLDTKLLKALSTVGKRVKTVDGFDGFQAGMFARFYVKKLTTSGKLTDMYAATSDNSLLNHTAIYCFSSLTKLSEYNFISNRCAFPVKSGIYFYEVTIFSEGRMRFGWCTWEAKLTETNALGDDQNSIGFDTLSNRVLFNSETLEENTNSTPRLSDWRVGDVIGCLIDITTKLFIFYINGREVKCCLMKQQFSTLAYYATASLTANQRCYFNFGQTSFRYPPTKMQYKSFHGDVNNEIDLYQLIEPNSVDVHYWFSYSMTEQIGDQFYCDDWQNKCDKLVKQLEEDKDGLIQIVLHYLKHKRKQSFLFKIRTYFQTTKYKLIEHIQCFRYIQALIEITGNHLVDDSNIYFVQYSEHHIKRTIANISEAQFCEFISAYIKLSDTVANTAKHRNICIVLQIVIRYCKNHTFGYVKHIKKDILNYLIKTFCTTNDKWARLYALFGLEAMELSEDEKESIISMTNDKISQLRNEWMRFEEHNAFESILSENEYYAIKLDYQLYFCYEWFCQNVLNTNSSEDMPASSSTIDQVKLNSSFASAQIKLSTDFFSARSDWNWQSVRSVCETGDAKTFYYEVLLLTSGPMRIGWTTRITELVKTEIGADEHSIGFDGHSKCVWHEGRRHRTYEIVDSTKWTAQNLDEFSLFWNRFAYKDVNTKWKAGDIVGCLIDTSPDINVANSKKSQKCHFYFYLNGKLLYYKANTFFSSNPYHAALSLSSHQQCILNLGQKPFKYRPARVDHVAFYDYYQQQQHLDVKSKKPSLSINKCKNIILNVESTTVTEGNIQMDSK